MKESEQGRVRQAAPSAGRGSSRAQVCPSPRVSSAPSNLLLAHYSAGGRWGGCSLFYPPEWAVGPPRAS